MRIDKAPRYVVLAHFFMDVLEIFFVSWRLVLQINLIGFSIFGVPLFDELNSLSELQVRVEYFGFQIKNELKRDTLIIFLAFFVAVFDQSLCPYSAFHSLRCANFLLLCVVHWKLRSIGDFVGAHCAFLLAGQVAFELRLMCVSSFRPLSSIERCRNFAELIDHFVHLSYVSNLQRVARLTND